MAGHTDLHRDGCGYVREYHMTLSANPNHYEQPTALGSTRLAIRDIWWYINGSHPAVSNSIPWECIDCWDGTTREQPASGDMNNLTSGNLWKPGLSVTTLPQDAWATFRNPGGCVAATFQIFVKMEAASQASNSLISLDDWAIGGGTDANPTIPATTLTQPPVGNGDGRFTNEPTFIWSVILDEGMFYMRMMATSGLNTSARWTYMGEVNTWNKESDDPRPFITIRNTAQANFNTTFQFVRISPIDSVTVVNVNSEVYYKETQDSVTPHNDLGVDYLSTINMSTDTVGHRFIMGQIRNVGTLDEIAPTARATCGITGSDFRFEVWSRASTEASNVSKWPPGTALAAGHTVITEASIPPELEPQAGGGGDATPPVVTFIDPLPGAQIRADQAITLSVTDDLGAFANIQLRVAYDVADPILPTETIYGGDELTEFEAFYEASTITAITNGFQFVLVRDGGWPSTPNFTASPIDAAGNIT